MSAPALSDLVQSCLDLRWNFDPVAATAAGIGDYDGRLGAYGDDDVKRYVAALKSSAGSLEECTPESLDDEIDRTALLDDLRVSIHRFSRERPHHRDPGFWVEHMLDGLYMLLARRERSQDHRARAAKERLEAVPEFLETAAATLGDCPRVFVDSALEVATAGSMLIEQVERELGAAAGEGFDAAARNAHVALHGFIGFVKEELRDGEYAEFAVGEEAFNFRLHYEHALRNTAPELWRYGLELVEQVQTELEEIARAIDGRSGWPDLVARLCEEHPSADGLVGAYAAEMERARRFVEERGLAPIPAGRLEVIATPDFLRPLVPFAAYQPPGAFSTDRTGWFYVTPPGEGAGQEEMLRDHCFHDLASTALHEGYPGHHLQFLHALAQPRLVRKVVSSALTVEGWALYCEEMMAEEGFFATPEQRLFQKRALLWRAVRIVLDVGLHTRGMSIDEAVDMLVREVHFDRSHAQAEVRRYCSHPAYQLCYAVGRRELTGLRDAYRAAVATDFTLREFHERVLQYGGLPVSLVRWGLGIED